MRDQMADSIEFEGKTMLPVDTGGITLAAVSLGCAKNRIDTEEILGFLARKGMVLSGDVEKADLVLVNTCAFIDDARRESFETIRKLAAGNSQGRAQKLVVAGCLVETCGKKLFERYDSVDGAIGVHSYQSLEKFIGVVLGGGRVLVKKPAPATYSTLSPRVLTTPAYSAYLRIAEGCNNHCHYCLIPRIRGPYRSRSPEEILAEIKGLLSKGTYEIVLIAQDTTAYGIDRPEYPGLSGLLRKILKIEGHYRIRIMYTYPSRIDNELIEVIASDKRICNYLDVPVQHAADRVLEAMGRNYRRRDLEKLFTKLRRQIPDLALRTTFMVGYPGEKRADFSELMSFIEEYPFENLGVFTYSRQQSTVAAGIGGQVPSRVAKRRYRHLMSSQVSIAHRQNRQYCGRKIDVLVEGQVRGSRRWYFGRSQYQAPEVDGKVILCSPLVLEAGSLVRVKIDAVSSYNFLAAGKNIQVIRG